MEGKKDILIVEDEEVLSSMYKDKLLQEGFNVLVAANIGEGLRLAEAKQPDLVILDIIFPEGSGISFLKQRVKHPTLNHIPVLVFSNLDDPATKKEAKKFDILAYLIKTNYTPRQVIERIRMHLNR